MKKRTALLITVAAVLITLLVTQAAPAMAAWIGGIRNTADIKEPLSATTITFEPQQVFPSQEITWAAEIKNTSTIPYGIKYDVWAFWDSMGMGMAAEQSFSRSSATAEPKLEPQRQTLTLALSATRAGGIYSNSIGELYLFVDPDGPGPLAEQAYAPNTKIDIQPNGIHALRLKLKVSPEAYSGTVVSYIDPFRGTPVAPPPTTTTP